MESRPDVQSILPLIPLILRSSELFWPPRAVEALKALALGPDVSRVESGEILFDSILDLRDALGISHHRLARGAAEGCTLFFDELMCRMDSRMWFGEVVPALAGLLLRLPCLMEAHYQHADCSFGGGKAGLRLLPQQTAGIVLLSQELIAALLACSFFCLFPTSERSSRHLPTAINFDYLFASLQSNTKPCQEQKIKCLLHYFERICLCLPTGFVSFERKVLSLESRHDCISYPRPILWRKSSAPLCSFKVFSSGFIEDQQYEAVEVDFANEFLGGGALHRGCVQEEIRFMINPELIIGMLFLSSMEDNESIEIVGVERFCSYSGYGSSFLFVGDYVDKKSFDSMGRHKTSVVAIDALCYPGARQYEVECLLRETNKAFCGFHDTSKYQCYMKLFHEAVGEDYSVDKDYDTHDTHLNKLSACEDSFSQTTNCSNLTNKSTSSLVSLESTNYRICQLTGVATGNWGCGAFGGDPELKSIIQWLAASQALKEFVHYYRFAETALERLDQVTQWILMHEWTVGDLWSVIVEYSSQKRNGKTKHGFLNWLLPMEEASVDAVIMSE